MSCDWETVKNVVPGNSSTKPDQTGGNGKGMKQSKMFNYSVYSRLGNNACWTGKYFTVIQYSDIFSDWKCELIVGRKNVYIWIKRA